MQTLYQWWCRLHSIPDHDDWRGDNEFWNNQINSDADPWWEEHVSEYRTEAIQSYVDIIGRQNFDEWRINPNEMPQDEDQWGERRYGEKMTPYRRWCEDTSKGFFTLTCGGFQDHIPLHDHLWPQVEDEGKGVKDADIQMPSMGSLLRLNDPSIIDIVRKYVNFPRLSHSYEPETFERTPYWGVVISCRGIRNAIDAGDNELSFDLQARFWALYVMMHELFHYLTERASISLQTHLPDESRNLYREYRSKLLENMKCGFENSCYQKGLDPYDLRKCERNTCTGRGICTNVIFSDQKEDGYHFPLEEAMANAQAYRKLGKVMGWTDPLADGRTLPGKNVRNSLREKVRQFHAQGVQLRIGYENLYSFVGDGEFEHGQMALGAMLNGAEAPIVNSFYDSLLGKQTAQLGDRKQKSKLEKAKMAEVSKNGSNLYNNAYDLSDWRGRMVPLHLLDDENTNTERSVFRVLTRGL